MGRQLAKIGHGRRGTTRGRFGQRFAEGLRLGASLDRSNAERRPTLRDDTLEKMGGEWRGHEHRGVDGARGLAKQSYIFRIAAESRNILFHPLERGKLIEQAVVAAAMMRRLGRQLGMAEESQNSQPIIDRDHE